MRVDNCIFIRSAFRNPLKRLRWGSEHNCDKNGVIQTPAQYLQIIFAKMQSKTVAQGWSVKKVFLKISQNSQENPCVRVSVLINLKPATLSKKRPWHWRFPVNFAKFVRTLFYRKPPGVCFYAMLWQKIRLSFTTVIPMYPECKLNVHYTSNVHSIYVLHPVGN